MKFEINNGFLEYERAGRGVPLLFIHGYPLSRKIWERQVMDLTDIADVISVDLRGHGGSYSFDPPYSMDLLAGDCYRLLSDLKINSPIIVCGLSMGGYVEFEMYRKYPQLFKGMILTSTRAGADTPEGKAGREAGVLNVQEHGVASIADTMLPKLVSPSTLQSKLTLVNTIREIMLETSVNGVIGALQGMRDRTDSTPILAQIRCPALIIHGEDDQLIPVSQANVMEEGIPSSRLVIVAKAGHLVNMEQPEIFNQVVREFIRMLS